MTRPKGNRKVSKQNRERARRAPSTPTATRRATKDRPAQPRFRDAFKTAVGGAPTSARKWFAIGAASVLATASFWLLVFAVVAPELDNPPANVWIYYVLGGVALPATYVALAFISQAPGPWRTAAIGTAVAAIAGVILLGLGALLRSGIPLPTIAVLALGAGGLLTLRMDDQAYLRPRIWSVLLAGVYSAVMLLAVPALGISLATLFPFNALGLADIWTERRRAKREAASS